ncbi:MAG: nucleoside 2-deoxyribosyltransferase [Candidatus Heimdallarchaeota archaeon]|nr:MAG: nucleoside 2-deoxyribosyltransferase [Candidatus Heimdallarchaeota archaeon]
MKIYLSCAIRGGRELQPNYQAILDYLNNNGHTILTYHVASPNVLEIEESMSDNEIFTQDILWLQECDVVIAEVSTPSLGVGYEIAYALGRNKPVLGVYDENKEKKVSAMITGNTSPHLTLRSYHSIPQLVWHIKNFISTLSDFD